jgi:phosphatidylglycerophosphate synthase
MQPASSGRLREIECFSNRRLIHPVSAALVPRFARWGVHPNAVSLSGAAAGLMAGYLYHRASFTVGPGFPDGKIAVLLGFALMLAWHVMDGADGQLARLTGKASVTGKIIDGVSDYAVWISVYVGIALSYQWQGVPYIWPLAVAAGVSHILHAAVYERQREKYVAAARAAHAAPVPVPPAKRPGPVVALIDAVYMAVQSRCDPACEAVGPETAEAYRRAFAPLVRHWSLMSANIHTLALFLAAILFSPMLYLWVEVVVLNAIFVVLLVMTRRETVRFKTAFEAPPAAA